MKTYTLKKIQFVNRSLEEVFDFFKQPENLERITPSALHFNILTPKPIKMEKGRLIDYTIQVFGMTQRWTTLITDYDPPNRFVDEQLKGPYSLWHHTHLFEAHEGGTKIVDEVKYAVPLGWVGEIAHILFVKKQLQAIFEHREKFISDYFSNQNVTEV